MSTCITMRKVAENEIDFYISHMPEKQKQSSSPWHAITTQKKQCIVVQSDWANIVIQDSTFLQSIRRFQNVRFLLVSSG